MVDVYSGLYYKEIPVICMDEKLVQQFENARKNRRGKENGLILRTKDIFATAQPVSSCSPSPWKVGVTQIRRNHVLE